MCVLFACVLGAAGAPELRLVSRVELEDGMEILAYDPGTGSLVGVGGATEYIYSIDGHGGVHLRWRSGFPGRPELRPTSIAVDPAGRGFAASSWIPTPVDAEQAVVRFTDLRDGSDAGQLPAGMHPDCVAFSPDGRYLLLANECEPGQSDLPGGLTLIDLSGVRSVKDLAGLDGAEHFGFDPEHLGQGVDLSGLRISAKLIDRPTIDIEPEYFAPTNEGVWVSLQENNALAYFEYARRKWTRIVPLGTMRFPFDAVDGDGFGLNAFEGFALLHEPDTIVLVHSAGRELLLLANEGEQNDEDIITLGEAIRAGLIDPDALDRLNTRYGDVAGRLGALRISTIDGDTDHDGDIDIPTAIGGRSISLIDTESGREVWNSGSAIETVTAERFPELYNAGDTRSSAAGPEPEGLAVGEIDGRTIAFVGLERTSVLMMYDQTDPLSPTLLAMRALGDACPSPEGLVFIDTGARQFLAVASELGHGCLTVYEIVLDGK